MRITIEKKIGNKDSELLIASLIQMLVQATVMRRSVLLSIYHKRCVLLNASRGTVHGLVAGKLVPGRHLKIEALQQRRRE